MTEPIVRTEPLGGSPLARGGIDGRLAEWYGVRPTSAADWKERAQMVGAGFPNRAWLDALRDAFAASGAAAARLERVANNRGIVVTTGQQPGLFGGPIYSWSKALSALALADEIEAATGIPAAPVFWAANDDADFAEASWTAVAVPGGAERLALNAAAPIGRPMSAMPLGDPSEALDVFVRSCGATVDTRAIDAVRDAYHARATVGSAYLALLRRLFEPLGIAVLDAAHDAVARASRPALLRALDRAGAVAAALHRRTEAIDAAGFTPQVTEVEGLSLVFERKGVAGDKRRIPLVEAAAIAASVVGGDDGRILSPNVLLRPVIERVLLPTVTYVAGPGEFAYFAQVSAVAESLGLSQPMPVPRWSATILEPHVTRILERLGVAEEELAHPHRVEGRLARASVPDSIARSLSDLRAGIEARTASLRTVLGDNGALVPPSVVDGTQRSMQHRLERLERRVVAAVKRRESDTMSQVGTARGSLYPLGTRQERALNLIPLIARHGWVIVDRMLAAARAHAHLLVEAAQSDGASTRKPAAPSRAHLGGVGDAMQSGRPAEA